MSKTEQSSDSLGDRMKSYEFLTTSRQLMPNTPVYARIDGRAFHTFCHGLSKPFSRVFIEAMQATCMFLVDETNACLGYVQSDEISLGWESIVKAPFNGRLQKLESNLASLATSKFVQYLLSQTRLYSEPNECDYSTKEEYVDALEKFVELDFDNVTMRARIDENPPSFDCRVFNVPSMAELANAFLWRENDALKNSITGMALSFYSHRELDCKSGDEKVHMMRMKGHCFYEDTDPAFMRGTFYHREKFLMPLAKEYVDRIPESHRGDLVKDVGTDLEGNVVDEEWLCWRSHIVPMHLPYRLTETENVEGVLFYGVKPRCRIENPTFNLDAKKTKMVEKPDREAKKVNRVFLSGPMTGIADFNFPLFNKVAKIYRERGWEVVNPVDICRKFKKERVLADKAVFDAMIAEQQEAERTCNAILLLPGWENSRGVRLELKTAIELNMRILEWQP